MSKINDRSSPVNPPQNRPSERSEWLADIVGEELGYDNDRSLDAPDAIEPRKLPAARRVYSGPPDMDDQWEAMRKRLHQSKPVGVEGGAPEPERHDILAAHIKDKQMVRDALHLLGIHDTARAFSGKPFTLPVENAKRLRKVKLVRDKHHQFQLLVINPNGEPLPMSLGTAYAMRVLGVTEWPFTLPTLVETRLWTGRLFIESDPGFIRTPLPWLTNEGLIQALTKKGGPFLLIHAVGLCVGLSIMLDCEQRYLNKVHRAHEGWVMHSQTFRPRWTAREYRDKVSAGQSDWAWGFLRKFCVIEMQGGELVDGRRTTGFYRINPVLQQDKFNVNEITQAAFAMYENLEKSIRVRKPSL